MADAPSSPATMEPNQSDNPNPNPNPNPDSIQSDPSLPASSTSTPTPPQAPSSTPATVTASPNPNTPAVLSAPPPAISSYAPPHTISAGPVVPPTAPSFRPAPPQFSLLPTPQNLAYQNALIPGVQPPGVSHGPVMVPGVASGAVSATVSVSPMMSYQIPPGQPPNPAMRPYMTMPNGYAAMPVPAPQGTLPPPGVLRYPSPYANMVRPAFAPRPPGAMGMLPVLPRPPFPGIPGIRPFLPPVVRPAVLPTVTPAEKPQTTVYVGRIAQTIDNDFMLSLLRLCGPVKSWKRFQASDGTPKGFGFCEFESAEGVLRVLRLLSKFNIDGQELVLNVNKATREYLERYVGKKTENSKKLKETEVEGAEKEEKSAPGADKNESPKPSEEDSKKDDLDSGNKESQETANFGIVTDEDREADREALEKLASMIEERIKTRPLPPPPPPPPVQLASDSTGNSKSEPPSKDGDSDVDIMRNEATDDKNDEDTTSENKPVNDHDRTETGSPNRSRRYDRSRDRERDLKREKEREFEKLEREAQRERERKERERDRKVQEAERAEREYKERVKEWESREREKERQRQSEKEREKERERKRKKEIKDDESDDDDSRKRLRRSVLEEKRRKRLREKEDDLDDKLKEGEEMIEAQRRANEEQEQRLQQQQEEDALKLLSGHVTNKSEDEVAEEIFAESKDKAVELAYEDDSGHANHIGDGILQNGMSDNSTMASIASSEMQQSSNAPARKLGFGLVGSGKRTAVPSVFTVEEDDAQNDKKMRPLVPIDYSNEELQAVQPSNAGGTPPNLAAAAEFAKRISNVNPKEEKLDAERERSRRSYDKSSQRDRDRSFEDSNRHRDENREKNIDWERNRERGPDKVKTPDNKKLLDAKQLIDMIPKTKEELFSYEINWAVYDKHELHERMRPWISKKITEFLGEEEHTLVDYIVSSTQEHVKASQMLELLQSILDDEAEMFVLKMWRMLIFEIKKVETGLALRSKT